MLERLYHSNTCLQILEMEDEISLSKENYWTESEWKTIPSLLELLKPFKQDQLVLEGDKDVTISHAPSSVIMLSSTLNKFAFTEEGVPPSVRGLAIKMVNDFGQRLPCTTGLKFHDVPERGSGNWMVGIRPVCIIANILDPTMRLSGLNLSRADEKKIKNKVLELMIVIS
jgi:hypothetical protein